MCSAVLLRCWDEGGMRFTVLMSLLERGARNRTVLLRPCFSMSALSDPLSQKRSS